MNTLEMLQDLLIKENGLTREQLAPEAELVALGIDSLGFVDLLFQIEDKFGIEIPGDNPAGLNRVGDVVAYIDTLRAAPRKRAPGGPRVSSPM
jgi:acyl carrier protein